MIKQIYDFINKLQDAIGDGAEASLSIAYNHIIIRVNWYKDRVTCKYAIRNGDILTADEGLYLDQLVMGFKRHRVNELGKRGENEPG